MPCCYEAAEVFAPRYAVFICLGLEFFDLVREVGGGLRFALPFAEERADRDGGAAVLPYYAVGNPDRDAFTRAQTCVNAIANVMPESIPCVAMPLSRPVQYAGVILATAGLILGMDLDVPSLVIYTVAVALGVFTYLEASTGRGWGGAFRLLWVGLLVGFAVSWVVVAGLPIVQTGAPMSRFTDTLLTTLASGAAVGALAVIGLLFTGFASGLSG